MIKKLKFILIISILCISLLELCFRLYEKYNPIIFASEYGIPCLEKIDHKIYYTLKKNCTKKIKYHYLAKKINFVTNSCRMRDAEEFCSYLKNRDLKKIFFFGDSYTQNPYVRNQFNYSKILSEILKENNLNYIDLNLGVSGYSILQNIDNLKKQINSNFIDSKDKIIFQFLLNDIYDITQHPPHPLKKYFNYSYTFKIINYVRRKIIFSNTYEKLENMIYEDYSKKVNNKLIKSKFCELSKVINENNLDLYFLYLPYMELGSDWNSSRVRKLTNFVINTAKECGIQNIINPTEKLITYKYKDLIISEDHNRHFNKKSNEIVAQYIFKSLIEIK